MNRRVLALFIAVSIISISGCVSSLGDDVPQAVCTRNCEFAYPVEHSGVQIGNTLTVKAYNVPDGQWDNKENYILVEKTFNEDEINRMDRISTKYGDKLRGRFDVIGCTYMLFSRGSGHEGAECSLY